MVQQPSIVEPTFVEEGGDEATVLVVRVPGAMPGERAQAVQRAPGRVVTHACPLLNETCTLKPAIGSWWLSVVQVGAPPAEVSFEVVKGRNEVSLQRAKTGAVLVRVIDPTGAPVMGAVISRVLKPSLMAKSFEARSSQLGRTDAHGEYTLALAVGQSELIQAAVAGSLDSELVTVRSTDVSIVLTLPRVPTFRGRVVRSDQQIVTRFSIDGRELTAWDGRFSERLDVSTRTSQRHVTFSGPGLVPVTRVVSAAAGDVDLGDVVLEGARVIRGRVLDRLTGQPLSGARVMGASEAVAECDALGQFTLGEQPLGAVSLVAHARGHASSTIDAEAEQHDVILRLQSGVSVSGVFTGGSRMTEWLVAVGPTVELARLEENQRFTFDTLSPGRWSFSPFHATSLVREGLPLDRQPPFVQQVLHAMPQRNQLELGASPVTNLELK